MKSVYTVVSSFGDMHEPVIEKTACQPNIISHYGGMHPLPAIVCAQGVDQIPVKTERRAVQVELFSVS